MNTKDNRLRTTDYRLQSTISTKEIDNILDSMVDNRTSTKAVIYIARSTDGQTQGSVIGKGEDIVKMFYLLLKQNDAYAELMLAALERLTIHTPDLQPTEKQ